MKSMICHFLYVSVRMTLVVCFYNVQRFYVKNSVQLSVLDNAVCLSDYVNGKRYVDCVAMLYVQPPGLLDRLITYYLSQNTF